MGVLRPNTPDMPPPPPPPPPPPDPPVQPVRPVTPAPVTTPATEDAPDDNVKRRVPKQGIRAARRTGGMGVRGQAPTRRRGLYGAVQTPQLMAQAPTRKKTLLGG